MNMNMHKIEIPAKKNFGSKATFETKFKHSQCVLLRKPQQKRTIKHKI